MFFNCCAADDTTEEEDFALTTKKTRSAKPVAYVFDEERKPVLEERLVVRVGDADLYTSSSPMGHMDVLAEVNIVRNTPEVERIPVGRTPTDYGGGQSPVWHYSCLGPPYTASADDSREFEIRVLEIPKFTTFGPKEVLLGTASIEFSSIFAEFRQERTVASSAPKAPRALRSGPLRKLPLFDDDEEEVGKIGIKVLLIPMGKAEPITELRTKIDPRFFETPVTRISVTGGSAPLFNLKVVNAMGLKISPTYFIGKDLSHTALEVDFYEHALQIKKAADNSCGLGRLLEFMFEYLGVFVAPEVVPSDVERTHGERRVNGDIVEMIAIRNLFDGAKKLRMIDIKMGAKTASAGWYGKSTTTAAYREIVDTAMTNSGNEGFRMAGFEGPPPSLTSRHPQMHFAATISEKKALKIQFGRLCATKILRYWTDVHQEPPHPGDGSMEVLLTPTELMEITLHEVVTRLHLLSIACRCVVFPQKWVGSSICLGFDAGRLPPRAGGEAEARKAVRVNIFDWGRSELNTSETMLDLSEAEIHDRTTFWRFYVGALDRFVWEATRAYHHQFCNTRGWSKLVVSVWDYDAASADDFLAEVEIPLTSASIGTFKLPFDCEKRHLDRGQLTYSLGYREMPASSRIAGVWRICIHKAEHLPVADLHMSSDPFVHIEAFSVDGEHSFIQSSSTKSSDLDPEWNETFEVPVMRSQNLKLPNRSAEEQADLLPPVGNNSEADLDSQIHDVEDRDDDAIEQFQALLDEMSVPYGGERIAGSRMHDGFRSHQRSGVETNFALGRMLQRLWI